MTPNEMITKLRIIEDTINEMHNLVLQDKELCNIDNGNCANFLLNEFECIKGHIHNIID